MLIRAPLADGGTVNIRKFKKRRNMCHCEVDEERERARERNAHTQIDRYIEREKERETPTHR